LLGEAVSSVAEVSSAVAVSSEVVEPPAVLVLVELRSQDW
jgi:hypothetical protein